MASSAAPSAAELAARARRQALRSEVEKALTVRATRLSERDAAARQLASMGTPAGDGDGAVDSACVDALRALAAKPLADDDEITKVYALLQQALQETSELEREIAELQRRLAAQDTRIAAQDTRIAAQDTRIAALQRSIAEFAAFIAEQRVTNARLAARLDALAIPPAAFEVIRPKIAQPEVVRSMKHVPWGRRARR
jgi:hypothetical protein